MYQEFANKTYSVSGASVTHADNTDFSVSGSSKKVVFTDAQDEFTEWFIQKIIENFTSEIEEFREGDRSRVHDRRDSESLSSL